jgi:hemin uptake protein HemP
MTNSTDTQSAPGAPREASEAGRGVNRWLVASLCGPSGEAILVHNGEDYRLRVTARGKLILTK